MQYRSNGKQQPLNGQSLSRSGPLLLADVFRRLTDLQSNLVFPASSHVLLETLRPLYNERYDQWPLHS
jgi:hypothetical protein